MSAERLVLPPDLEPGDLEAAGLQLRGDTAHHLLRAARLKPGDEVLVGDGLGATRPGRLSEAAGDTVGVEWTGELRREPRPAPAVVLVLGVPDGKDLVRAVVNATEAGADRVILTRTSRSVRPLPVLSQKTWVRLSRAVREACAQCRRVHLPELDATADLPSAVSGAAWLRVCVPGAAPAATVTPPVDAPGPWTAVVGPEGGLSPEETAWLTEIGAVPLWLGPTVLRTRTAATAQCRKGQPKDRPPRQGHCRPIEEGLQRPVACISRACLDLDHDCRPVDPAESNVANCCRRNGRDQQPQCNTQRSPSGSEHFRHCEHAEQHTQSEQ